ncbi:hypothetical protein C5167_014118 [Papaver somniferum]|uniref:Uncharacterized protein n=1 Tax=Papaver somniferum TaxID=3469 RepID=A0A4Y7J298_PAPSO|nr:hypothetical protein C5167_014118 [Papaver somniferum]
MPNGRRTCIEDARKLADGGGLLVLLIEQSLML